MRFHSFEQYIAATCRHSIVKYRLISVFILFNTGNQKIHWHRKRSRNRQLKIDGNNNNSSIKLVQQTSLSSEKCFTLLVLLKRCRVRSTTTPIDTYYFLRRRWCYTKPRNTVRAELTFIYGRVQQHKAQQENQL